MTIKKINPATAKNWLDQEEALLVDVREPIEYAASHIAGAALHPLQSVHASILPNTESKIIIYCQKGIRSLHACQLLLAENQALELYNLEGGIEAWQEAGLPVQRQL